MNEDVNLARGSFGAGAISMYGTISTLFVSVFSDTFKSNSLNDSRQLLLRKSKFIGIYEGLEHFTRKSVHFFLGWGSLIVNFVPLPTWLSKSMAPFRASTSLLQTASPNPVPLDFVVNNGWKSCGLNYENKASYL